MANLLDSVKDVLTDALMDKAASAIGMDGSSMTSAVGKFLPGIIGGLIGKGSTESGAGQLLNLLGGDALKNFDLGNLVGMLGDSKQTNSLMDMGGNLLNGFLGNKQSGLLDSLMSMTGVNKSGGSMLMKFLAPIVLKKLGGMVMSNGWGAKALSSYLGTQKSSIASAVPGLGGLLGFASGAKETASAATSAARETVSSGGGGGWMKWLLPLLLIGAAAWYFTKDGCAAKTTEATTTSTEMTGGDVTTGENTTTTTTTTGGEATTRGEMTTTTTTTGGATVDFSSYKMVDGGDIVDGAGTVVFKNGSYALDKAGNLISDAGAVLIPSASLPVAFLDRLKAYLGKYAGTKLSINDAGDLVDGAGTVILKKGEFEKKNGFYVDSNGNKLGRVWGKIVEAIKGAAGKTKEAMTALFSDMVTKKAGASGDYYLSNIEWADAGNRIKGFSKGEIEGLAAALKANADGKIVVKATTNEGKNDKENKKIAKDRANVVHDMLVALGVDAKQLSFEGAAGENNVAVVVK